MRLLYAGLGVAIVIAVWQLMANAIAFDMLFPPPRIVGATAYDMIVNGSMTDDVGASLWRLLMALLIGVPAGILIGVAIGWWPIANAIVQPFIRMCNAIPAIALVPFSLLWLGVTEQSRIALLVYTITLTVLISTRAGVRNVSRIKLRAGECLGVRGPQALFKIVLPSCIPAIIIGIRTAIGLGVMVVVAAEMLGAESGVGYRLMQARSQFDTAALMASIIGLGLLALLLDRAFEFAVETLLPRYSTKRRIK
jgi:NitT/TauT family transport system permease protein